MIAVLAGNVRTWLLVCGGHGGARVKKMRTVTVLHVSRASVAVMVVRGTSFAKAWWCRFMAGCANGAHRGGRWNRCRRWCETTAGCWCVAVAGEKMVAAAAMVMEGEEKIRVRVSFWEMVMWQDLIGLFGEWRIMTCVSLWFA